MLLAALCNMQLAMMNWAHFQCFCFRLGRFSGNYWTILPQAKVLASETSS